MYLPGGFVGDGELHDQLLLNGLQRMDALSLHEVDSSDSCNMAELVTTIARQVVHRQQMPQNMAWKLSCLGLGA